MADPDTDGEWGEFSDLRFHLQIGFIFAIIMAILSIIGAIGILVSYIKCPQERNTIRQLLLLLTLADCILAITNLSGSINFLSHMQYLDYNTTHSHVSPDSTIVVFMNVSMNSWCIAQSYVSTSASLVSIFYNICIAAYFYTVAVINSEKSLRRRIIWIHLVCWVIPICILTTALLDGALGSSLHLGAANTGHWCSINGRLPWREQITWMVLTRHGWEIVAYILGPVFWCLVFYEMYKHRERCASGNRFSWINIKIGKENPEMRFREDDWNFRFIPLIFYLLRMWGTIRFVLSAIVLNEYITLRVPAGVAHWLYVMICIGDNAQGFVNFLLFCVVDRRIRKAMLAYMCKTKDNPETQRIIKYLGRKDHKVNKGNCVRNFDDSHDNSHGNSVGNRDNGVRNFDDSHGNRIGNRGNDKSNHGDGVNNRNTHFISNHRNMPNNRRHEWSSKCVIDTDSVVCDGNL